MDHKILRYSFQIPFLLKTIKVQSTTLITITCIKKNLKLGIFKCIYGKSSELLMFTVMSSQFGLID